MFLCVPCWETISDGDVTYQPRDRFTSLAFLVVVVVVLVGFSVVLVVVVVVVVTIGVPVKSRLFCCLSYAAIKEKIITINK